MSSEHKVEAIANDINKIIRPSKYLNHISSIIQRNEFNPMSENIFFTADLHFGHQNIIKYCDRPWRKAEEMNKGLIDNWNSIVNENDEVYILGDLTLMGSDQNTKLAAMLYRMKGKKHLICGNHDKLKPSDYIDIGFNSVHYPYFILNNWILVHDPALAIACPENSIIFCGHVHNSFGKILSAEKGRVIINVGVDVWDYIPVSLETIKDLIKEETR
jgi:calcineurin-like phosphoesterase family protein